MFKKIMVPLDLAHVDKLGKALGVAADLADHYSVPICYVGVTASTPGSVAHNPEEYAKKLEAFSVAQSEALGLATQCKSYVTHDPAVDLDDALLRAVEETGADLVVMASHIPNIADYIWPSNGGKVSSHAKVSVLLVR